MQTEQRQAFRSRANTNRPATVVANMQAQLYTHARSRRVLSCGHAVAGRTRTCMCRSSLPVRVAARTSRTRAVSAMEETAVQHAASRAIRILSLSLSLSLWSVPVGRELTTETGSARCACRRPCGFGHRSELEERRRAGWRRYGGSAGCALYSGGARSSCGGRR
jgi:hypothetical protein